MNENNSAEGGENKENVHFFPVVAIGASAGGVEAITELLQNLSPDNGIGYVYIQHLDSEHKSALVPILQRVTTMQVNEVKEGMQVQTDHIFIIPPNVNLTIENGVFQLSKREPHPARHSPIDEFFLSLADNHKAGCIGVILSGTASDGTIGLKAIRQAGGLTYAQDDSALFHSMPASAIAEEAVDLVLSPKAIAENLNELSKKGDLLHSIQLFDRQFDSTSETGNYDFENLKTEEINELLHLIKDTLGVNFINYKTNTIRRRIAKRMLVHKLAALSEYIEFCHNNRNELDILYGDFLINVTHFFRDKEAVDYLQKELLPEILKNKSTTDPLRIWVPACSSGEEAYSMSILIAEVLEERNYRRAVQIFATDLSEAAIAKARVGLYSASDVTGVSDRRLDKYFTKVDGHYRISKRIRDICVFAPHNILKDPPFSNVDLISCCNLLIYLDASLQKKLLTSFHYALRKKGYLILGKSETVTSSVNLFAPLNKKLKIFIKKSDTSSPHGYDFRYLANESDALKTRGSVLPVIQNIRETETLEKIIDGILLTQYVPSGVVINYDFEILTFRGSTGMFLEPLPGKASLNLLKMVRPGLEVEIRNAVQKAIKTVEFIKVSGLNITLKGNIHHISFEVVPLVLQTHQKLMLIVFEEVKTPSPAELKINFSKDRRVKQLETELTALREDLRSIVEEQETANEELQSANEEIVSSNEELQSINEELETSKEELESTNEELITINQELQVRNEQLSEAHEYTQYVIATIREAVIVLDAYLRVKTANEAFYRIFKCREEKTEGNLIYEINQRQWDIPGFRELLEKATGKAKEINGFELNHDFLGVGEKVLLINLKRVVQQSQGQQFLLIAIEDITEHRKAEKLLQEREEWTRNMADNVPVMIWVAGADKNFTFLNKTWLSYTGRTLQLEAGIGWTEGIHKDDLGTVLSTFHGSFEKQENFIIEYRMRRYDGEYRWILNNAVVRYDNQGEFSGYTGSCTEIHDKRVMNEELEKMVAERTMALNEANANLALTNNELGQFAYIASHDLQEPLRKISTFTNRLKERFGETLPEGSIEFVDKINSSSEKMRSLIDNLLKFSTISQMDKSFPLTDLNKIMRDVISDFDLLIQEKNAVVKVSELPTVPAIPLQMNQLFYNLLSNALKFTHAGVHPLIEVDFRELPGQETEKISWLNPAIKYVEISFKDNGIGFSAEYSEQIFVIFQRLNEKGNFPGTGIGLALCRKIVRNHGGEIYATSKDGKQTIFNIILPSRQTVENGQ